MSVDAYEDIPVEASDSDIPAPVNGFGDVHLGERFNQNTKRCKYVKPTPIQLHAIPIAMAGRDLIACAQTGSGKTAAFCFRISSGILNKNSCSPSLPRYAQTACHSAPILSLTRELAGQIHDEIKKFAYQIGLKIVAAYGGASISIRVSLQISFQTTYFWQLIGRVGSSTDLIAQKVDYFEDVDKRSHLVHILHAYMVNGARAKLALTLVFVETKKGANALEYWLSVNGFPAIAIQGDKVQMEREQALKSFKSRSTPILVATYVTSRGLDIPHVAHVINVAHIAWFI